MVHSPSKCKKPPIRKQAGVGPSASTPSQTGSLKLQRGSKPLNGKKFFFDVRNHSTAARLEKSIKSYGGVVIPFIGSDVDLVVTDRAEWGGPSQSGAGGSPLCAGGTPKPSPSPSPLPPLFSPLASPAGNSRGSNFSPSTLDSPSDYHAGGRRHPKSRAEAMIERVRSQPQFRTRDPLVDAQSLGLKIFSVEKVFRYLQRIAQSHKGPGVDNQITPLKHKSETNSNKVKFRTGKYFIKIESHDRQYRPSYKNLSCWPTINLNSEPGTSPFLVKPTAVCVPSTRTKVEVKAAEEPSALKIQTVSLDQNKGSKPSFKRSPRKKNSPAKLSPSKRNVSGRISTRKGTNFVFQDSESVSLVPPRPPSKRHPERCLFPSVKKEAELYDPLPGYCEICKVDYNDLKRHCQTSSHKEYSMNAENYAQLDKQISLHSADIESFLNSLLPVNTRHRKSESLDHQYSSETSIELDNGNGVGITMRQPVDERQLSSKMVGRKEALEVQCNGISNHVQTRFTKGDRENIGGIFLEERLNSAQCRKRRSISVSCKDLLEIAPGTERTHYLRSGRPARSELSQLSPALSDNSHPLLNSNNNQPLLSPTLSERAHHLRTRSQIWSNVIDEEALLVTTSNHTEKLKPEKASDKVDKSDKGEKSDKVDRVGVDEVNNCDVGIEKEVKDHKERELRPPYTHSRNRSIRRKRLSAEEKLIEDNRGYYKVEVLNSKLRSTGYFVQNSNQGEVTVNGGCIANGPGRSTSHEEKEPVVVRFKKVRRSELSVLSDEAENFMFGEQTKSDTNSDNSSESEEEEEEEDDDADDDDEDNHDDDSGGTDSNGINENGTDSSRSRSSHRNGHRSSSSGRRGSERLHRIKIRVGNDSNHSRCAAGESGMSSQTSSSEPNGFRRFRKRRTQAEAFITDNLDYYKFEIAGSRLRDHSCPISLNDAEDSSTQDKSKACINEETSVQEAVDSTPCPIDDLHFSFESVPKSELWFQTFERQDRGEELFFPSVGEPSPFVLPYQLPKRDSNSNQCLLGKRKSRSSVRLPRKSPRCHASTLAILSSVVKRRSSKEPEKVSVGEPSATDVSAPELKTSSGKVSQPTPSGSDLQTQTVTVVKEIGVNGEGEIQDIAKSIDSMLGLGCAASSDVEKDQDSHQAKPYGKGRNRKKMAAKPASSSVANNVEVVLESDKEKDPSLNYLVDPSILEELACTCDVVSDPRGGPTMDILSLLDSYSDCCCISDELSLVEHGVDASCNSSECGTSSTCDADRRLKKKRKRRNMTGWDKPKRKCILRRDVLGVVPEEATSVKGSSSKDTPEDSEPFQASTDSELNVQKVPNSISSPSAFQRKCGTKRKLRSSLSVSDSPRKSNICGQTRLNVMKMEKDGEVSLPVKKGKCRKVRRLGWSKAR